MSNSRFKVIFFSVVALLAGVIFLVWIGYSYAWSGFGPYVKVTWQGQEVVRGKTLWDWMELLIVPLTLAVGGAWFTHFQRQRDLQIAERNRQRDEELAERNQQRDIELAERNAQETALQIYLDQMTRLMIDKGLTSNPKPELNNVARVWTLATLRRLDGNRKGVIVEFLQEAGLISTKSQLVSLAVADLRSANLSGKSLRGANFSSWSNPPNLFKGAYLTGADLSKANLSGAKLVLVDLCGANLSGARLLDADLTGAKYNKATIWPDNFNFEAAGAVPVDDEPV